MSRVYLRFFHVVSSLISFFHVQMFGQYCFLFVVLDVGYSQSCPINFRVGTLALVCFWSSQICINKASNKKTCKDTQNLNSI